MRGLAALCMLALTLVPAAAAEQTYTYVAGTHPPADLSGFCTHGGLSIGGECGIVPSDPSSVTITVVDALGNPAGFYWRGEAEPTSQQVGVFTVTHEDGCGMEGEAFGSITISLADGCVSLGVYPDLGSLAGTITVS